MAEQLKIVIDAEVSGALSGLKSVGNVASTEFKKILGSASAMEASITSSIQKINSSLAGLKVSSIDLNVNTSQIDSAIAGIKTKFSTITDPKLNILANATQAEATINDLIGDISKLKGSEIFIRANDAQALKVINEVEAELKSILDKQINLKVNTTGITDTAQRIKALEQQLINLEALKVSPDISSTQLKLFESNIQRIKSEIASLKTQALVVPIGVDVVKAQASVNILSESIETLRARAEAKKIFITTETDITKIAAYNKEIQTLEAQVRRLQNVGKKGFELFVVPNQTINSVKNLTAQVAAFGGGVKTFVPPAIAGFKQLPSAIAPVINQLKALEAQSKASGAGLGNAFRTAFSSVRQLALILPGIGVAGIFGVVITALTELTESLFKTTAAAVKNSDAIEGAADEYAHAISSVNELKTNIQLAKEGFISKDGVVKQYNESIGKTTGLVKTLDEAEKELGKNADAYIKFTLLKAAANFALEEASKKAVKAALIPNEDIKKNLNFFQRLNLPFEKAPSRAAQEQKFLAPVIAGVQKEQKEFEKIASDFQTEAAKIAKDMGFSFFDDFKIDKSNLNKEFDDTIARAKQFAKEFGNAFVVPDLEESFFVSKDEIFKRAKKLLSDIKTGDLKIKLPVQITTEADFIFNPDDFKRGEQELKELTDRFFKDIKLQRGIDVDVIPDISLSKSFTDKIDKKLDLKKQFEEFGSVGTKAFDKIFDSINTLDFKQLTAGIEEANRSLEFFKELQKDILATAGLVTDVLSPAFNEMFDAIVAGENPLKAFFNGLIKSVNQLVKKLIAAAIQAAILSAITGGASGSLGGFGKIFSNLLGFSGSANLGGGGFNGGIGQRSFNNSLELTGSVNIAGQDLNVVLSRAQSSNRRF